MNVFLKINKFITKISFQDKVNKYNYFALALAAGLGHVIFGLYWTYIDPQKYESVFLRGTGIIICLILLSILKWKGVFKKFVTPYWIFAVIYNLPFFYTVTLIRNDFSDIWFVAEAMMIFTVILFLTHLIRSLLAIITGIFFAVLFCYITAPETVYFSYDIIRHAPIYVLTIIAGYVFSLSNNKGLSVAIEVKEQQKQKILQSLGGSIAHEMRNPLGAIKQSSTILTDKVQRSLDSNNIKPNSPAHKYLIDILEISELISHSSTRGNMTIDMILSNIHGKEIDKNKFKIFPISDIINIVMKEFAFEEGEKEKTSIDIQDNFHFKGDENMMVFVLFNLLKNALFYLKTYPKSKIIIYSKNEGDKNKTDDNKSFNYLYFRDTGAGIASNKLESIFESFMTSGKEGGTGLGLPFCRRVITAFDGTIICDSQLEKYTEFVIKLPKISEEDKKNKSLFANKNDIINNKNANAEIIIKENYSNKTILIVDDQSVNRIVTGSRLEKMNFKIIHVKHGQDALNILNTQGNTIDLILMDLNMPEIDGYEATKLIKLGYRNKEKEPFENFKNYKTIPIIAFTGDDDDETIQKIKDSKINSYLGKDWSNDDLMKVLKKCFK